MKINSWQELKNLREKLQAEAMGNENDWVVAVGMATCGVAAGANATANALNEAISKHGLKNAKVIATGCYGNCYAEPVVEVRKANSPAGSGIRYGFVNAARANEIVETHLLAGRTLENAIVGKEVELQERIAMRNCGVIDPSSLEDYIVRDGYEALAKSLFEMTPESVIAEVKQSGLRGRGGAGFPTGLKWEAAADSSAKNFYVQPVTECNRLKYVMCNADEGDPGAFMDRSILEGDPHSVLEAMTICGRAIGADEGIIYIRAEYPAAVATLNRAIAQSEEAGFLGENILGSGFNFKIRLYLGAGAFVCGEETSLMNSVQGGRGEPRIKPPFPAQKGLWNRPTNINNVETFANINQIILNGADWFKQFGNEDSPGTKVFALAGKVNNVGLIEIPMGTSLRDVIDKIGGGVANNKRFKAIQTGGPSGGCIPAQHLDTPVDYKSLRELGSIMGSGGMVVMDEDDCMVAIAKFFLEFTAEESCGKCAPCRIGNMRLMELLTRITKGQGTRADLDEIENLSHTICDTSLCGLGQSSPNPVLSTLKFFREEYLAHVEDKRCPAGACTALLVYEILAEKCTGCTVCKKTCPADCISGERKKAHAIDTERCIKCGVCMEKCPFGAIVKR